MARHAGVEINPQDWRAATTFRCWSTCSRPENISASGSTAPAACRPCCASCCAPDASTVRALTVTGNSVAENIEGRETTDREMITAYDAPLQERAGFLVMKGNLFDFAIMKTSVISEEFRAPLSERTRAAKACSRAAPSCSTAPTIITRASTIPRSTSTSAAFWSSAARGRSAGRARPKWSTCSRPMRC